MSTPDVNSEAEVQRLRAMVADLEAMRAMDAERLAYVDQRVETWKRRAERWKTYAQLIRAQAMFDLMCSRTHWRRLVKRYRRMQVQGHPWAKR